MPEATPHDRPPDPVGGPGHEPDKTMDALAEAAERVLRLDAADLRRLARVVMDRLPPQPLPPTVQARRARLVAALTVASAFMIPWIIVLSLTLPREYTAADWRQTWVGYDLVLLAGLVSTAYFGWRQRQLVLPAAFTTGLLLLCDAWFDVTTAAGPDRTAAVSSAFALELPLGCVLVTVAVLMFTSLVGAAEPEREVRLRHIWSAPLHGPQHSRGVDPRLAAALRRAVTDETAPSQ
jgi:hypothetical protein